MYYAESFALMPLILDFVHDVNNKNTGAANINKCFIIPKSIEMIIIIPCVVENKIRFKMIFNSLLFYGLHACFFQHLKCAIFLHGNASVFLNTPLKPWSHLDSSELSQKLSVKTLRPDFFNRPSGNIFFYTVSSRFFMLCFPFTSFFYYITQTWLLSPKKSLWLCIFIINFLGWCGYSRKQYNHRW